MGRDGNGSANLPIAIKVPKAIVDGNEINQ